MTYQVVTLVARPVAKYSGGQRKTSTKGVERVGEMDKDLECTDRGKFVISQRDDVANVSVWKENEGVKIDTSQFLYLNGSISYFANGDSRPTSIIHILDPNSPNPFLKPIPSYFPKSDQQDKYEPRIVNSFPKPNYITQTFKPRFLTLLLNDPPSFKPTTFSIYSNNPLPKYHPNPVFITPTQPPKPYLLSNSPTHQNPCPTLYINYSFLFSSHLSTHKPTSTNAKVF